jgi:hypothetical protein
MITACERIDRIATAILKACNQRDNLTGITVSDEDYDGRKTKSVFYAEGRGATKHYWCKEESIGVRIDGVVFTRDELGYLELGRRGSIT